MSTLTGGSLFAGIDGFGIAMEGASIEVKWQVEIDGDCIRVLERHWPNVARQRDIREAGAHNLEPVDIITFGSPCQDLSVAGQRAGLEGERSGLFYEAIRIVGELKPAFAVWENVPGVLSSHAGRDFGAVLDAFQELGARDIAWRTLDAQHFGVPQRRRRIFLVADFGGERAAEVLFEPESVQGDSPSRREAGAGLATRTAASLRHGGGNGRGYNLDAECGLVAGPLLGGHAGGHRIGADEAAGGQLVVHPEETVAGSDTTRYGKGPNTTLDDGALVCVTGERMSALTSEGMDASEDGTGRGTPMVFEARLARNGRGRPEEVAPPLKAQSGQTGKGDAAPLVFSQAENQRGEVRTSETHPQLTTGGGKPGQSYPAVAFAWQQGDDSKHSADGRGRSWVARAGDYTGALSGTRHDAVAGAAYGVRRLTPTECERLMGLPDGWTEGLSDSARYRCLGNSVAVPVVEWIMRRLVAAIPNRQEAPMR